MATNKKKGGCSFSAGQRKSTRSTWDGLVTFIPFMFCYMFMWHMLRVNSFSSSSSSSPTSSSEVEASEALKPLPRLLQPNCGSSWQASRIAAWIPAEPPKGPWRTPVVMECVPAAQAARHNPQQWKSVSGCVWMFFFFCFCTTFYEQTWSICTLTQPSCSAPARRGVDR